MNNPWIEFKKQAKHEHFILDADAFAIEKFNNQVNDIYRVHTDIMPAPFLGNVFNAKILLLLLNPGYDEVEEQKGYYKLYKHYWENEIQHIPSNPDLPLFCLEEEYTQFSNYWEIKLKYLIQASSKTAVAKNIAIVQFFPYHTKKFKSISNRIQADYLDSQKYNFDIVNYAINRKSIVIILRGRKHWIKAVPALDGYENLFFTNSYLNTIITRNNISVFDKLIEVLT